MNAPLHRLDSAQAAPDTGSVVSRGGAAEGAAAQVSEVVPPAADEGPLVAKITVLRERLVRLRADGEQLRADSERMVARARGAAHDAQVREAVARSELGLALLEALIGQAEARRAARAATAARYIPGRAPAPKGRRGLARRFDRLLWRLGAFGKAAVLGQAGVWRASGRRLFDLRHMAAYVRRGADPALRPPALFDQAWYLRTNPDVVSAGAAPLAHYVSVGAREGRSPHPLFDVAFYAARHGEEIAAMGLSPLAHFVQVGEALGLDPHPLFDLRHYASQAPQLAPGEHLIEHYLREGWRAGLSPHPLFDPAFYASQTPRAERETPPLLHYLTGGWQAGFKPHVLFDPAWYLETHGDVAGAGTEPLTHFVTVGAREGRAPGPWFDTAYYLAARGEALPASRNPLVDYLEGGAWLVAESRPGFATVAYLTSHPQIARDGVTPLEHWARRRTR